MPIVPGMHQLMLLEAGPVEEHLEADGAGERSPFLFRATVDFGVGGQAPGSPKDLATVRTPVALLVRVNVQVVFEGQEVVEFLLARGTAVEACGVGFLVVEEAASVAVRPVTAVTFVGPLLLRWCTGVRMTG